MTTARIKFRGTANVGLYGFVTNKYGLVGYEVPSQTKEKYEDIFDVPIHRVSIAGTSLLGAFIAGTDEKILIPNIVFQNEKESLEELDIDFYEIETKNTCLGNNILIGDDIILVNPEMEKIAIQQIEKIFDKEVIAKQISNTNAIGNLVVHNQTKGLVSNDISEEEFQYLETNLDKDLTPGSVNMGSPYVKTGVLVNKNGLAVGDLSGGPEVTNAERALGFVDY